MKRASDALMGDTLRRIVFAKVNVNLIRLHSGADPAFGKILHNLDVALTRTGLFEKYVRFGETMLACSDSDLSLNLPPPSLEYLREQFSRVVLIQDSAPTMLKKLYALLVDQQEYQRIVPVLWVGILMKEVYALGSETRPEPTDSALEQLEQEDVVRLVEEACAEARAALRPTYVDSGKMSAEMFDNYVQSACAILTDSALGTAGARSFYECLQIRLPELTKEEYVTRHKPIQEYVVRISKAKLGEKIKPGQSAR
jgi:hypothetical protein